MVNAADVDQREGHSTTYFRHAREKKERRKRRKEYVCEVLKYSYSYWRRRRVHHQVDREWHAGQRGNSYWRRRRVHQEVDRWICLVAERHRSFKLMSHQEDGYLFENHAEWRSLHSIGFDCQFCSRSSHLAQGHYFYEPFASGSHLFGVRVLPAEYSEFFKQFKT